MVAVHLVVATWPMEQEVSVRQARELKDALAVSFDFTLYAEKVKTEKFKYPKGIYDYGVRIRETQSGNQVKDLAWEKEWGDPSEGCFSPDGKMLAITSGGVDRERTAKVFDLSTGQIMLNVRHLLLKFVAFSPDSKKLASAGGPGASDRKSTLWVWDLGTRKKRVISAPSTPTCLSFSPDGKLIVAGHGKYRGDQKASLSLYDSSSGKMLARWAADDTQVTAAAFSPNGRAIASCGKEGIVRVWGAANRKELASFDDHQDEVFDLAFHPTGKLLASTGKDKTIRWVDLDKKKLVFTTRLEKLIYHLRLMFSADGAQFATYTPTGQTITLWSIELTK
jgi:WD40 repeat protein